PISRLCGTFLHFNVSNSRNRKNIILRTIGQRYYRSFFVQQISNITAKSRWKIKEILDFFLRVV
ncbi:hypothetical protein, partial [Roseburia intestinalis]|uniref:hypothetical protein n=1 Tax=Roseburia intestinalis TaxID=166486 RepID=UPI001A9A8FCF